MALLFDPPVWAATTNIYEVNLRQYTVEGNFEAFKRHLPRLADMGVEVLWFMPLTPISRKGMKGSKGSYYACSSYRKINAEFGTEEDFKSLVAEIHRLGMKVIVDWVANHTGLDHEWIQESPEFYLRDQKGNFTEKNGWDDVIDLDYNNPSLGAEMISCMQWWLETFKIDGFRCDMAHLVPLAFWKDARTVLDADIPHFWLAECEEVDYHQVFDTTYTWKWMHASRKFADGLSTLQDLWELLYKLDRAFPPNALRAWFTSNHDENSWNGTEYEKYGGLALPLAVFSAMWNGTPLIYSGQELPNNKRLRFFDKDYIEWTDGPVVLHDFYKKLLGARKSHKALSGGDSAVITYRIVTSHPHQCFCFMRQHGADRVVVLINFSDASYNVQLQNSLLEGQYHELFTGDQLELTEDRTIAIKPYEYRVWVAGMG